MDGRSILLLVTKLCLVFVLFSATFGNSQPALTNNNHDERRKLATGNPGFISIDCGADEDYLDDRTAIFYKSDRDFISTGKNQDISQEFTPANPYFQRQLNSLRVFPQGRKNCYTLQPEQGKNHNYEIRAYFMYGNYDAKNQSPQFDLYFGVNYWATVKLEDASSWIFYGMIQFFSTDTIHVCLINIGFGVPFISALELRLLDNSIYRIESGSVLAPVQTFDLGNPTKKNFRYKDDIYDRIWWAYDNPDWVSINTTSDIDIQGSNDSYKLPVEVLKTAAQPRNGLNSLTHTYNYSSYDYYVNFHFAEIVEIPQGRRRELTITMSGVSYGPFTLEYLKPQTIHLKSPVRGLVQFSVNSTMQSGLPPILNAFDILLIHPLHESPTDSADVGAIMAIKLTYKINRDDWQGDPCLPRDTSWNGLSCSKNNNITRIVSLNLSSSNLTGKIASSFSNLKVLQSLDLSYNELTGTVPEFLAQLPNLTVLNLTGNKLTGSVPKSLLEKSNNGTLQLSLNGNANLCQTFSCERKKQRSLLPIIASIISISVLLLLGMTAIFWRKNRQAEIVSGSRKESSLKSKNPPFTYSEVVNITNNFTSIIGEGGFGKVYLGNLKDGTPVAVKLFSQSSKQGYKEFQSEVQFLMMVYHRNLVSLIGYCEENENMALVYEYMGNGNLRQHLSAADKSKNVLNWRERLQIAVDAAHGLEYLHNGCKPTIIHRDMKTSNILLSANLQAKIADFGLSRAFATERDSYVTSRPAGTFGYLDPEFHASGSINKKSDVYSFGVVLFEIITGLPAVIRSDEDSIHIVTWVSPIIERGDIQGIVDSRLQGEFNTNSAWKAVEIAMSCVTHTAKKRPDMSDVLGELKECLNMELASGRIQSTGSSLTRLNNSLDISSLALDSEIDPIAR